jgi:hypothetical protein
VAFDILKRKEVERSWSRGSFIQEAVGTRALEVVKKKVPWTPILIGGGIGLAGLLFLTSGKKTRMSGYVRETRDTEPTRQVPYESMGDLVFGKKG